MLIDILRSKPLLFALNLAPRKMQEFFLTNLVEQLHFAYPTLQEKLRAACGKSFLFRLSELKFDVLLKIDDGQITPKIMSLGHFQGANATIYSSLPALAELLLGEQDGDSLFFSRTLEFEGDTEAILVLRNSLDSQDINFARIFSNAPKLYLTKIQRFLPSKILAAD